MCIRYFGLMSALVVLLSLATSAKAVINGIEPGPTDHRFDAVVSVWISDNGWHQRGSGTLIAPDTVITAAHVITHGWTSPTCGGFRGSPEQFTVCFHRFENGTIGSGTSPNDFFHVQAVSIQIVPLFDRCIDVAIIKLATPIAPSHITPMPVDRSFMPPPGSQIILAGWGEDANHVDSVLRYGTRTSVAEPPLVGDSLYYVGTQAPVGGTGLGSNDSGGAYLIDDGSGNVRLVATVIFGGSGAAMCRLDGELGELLGPSSVANDLAFAFLPAHPPKLSGSAVASTTLYRYVLPGPHPEMMYPTQGDRLSIDRDADLLGTDYFAVSEGASSSTKNMESWNDDPCATLGEAKAEAQFGVVAIGAANTVIFEAQADYLLEGSIARESNAETPPSVRTDSEAIVALGELPGMQLIVPVKIGGDYQLGILETAISAVRPSQSSATGFIVVDWRLYHDANGNGVLEPGINAPDPLVSSGVKNIVNSGALELETLLQVRVRPGRYFLSLRVQIEEHQRLVSPECQTNVQGSDEGNLFVHVESTLH